MGQPQQQTGAAQQPVPATAAFPFFPPANSAAAAAATAAVLPWNTHTPMPYFDPGTVSRCLDAADQLIHVCHLIISFMQTLQCSCKLKLFEKKEAIILITTHWTCCVWEDFVRWPESLESKVGKVGSAIHKIYRLSTNHKIQAAFLVLKRVRGSSGCFRSIPGILSGPKPEITLKVVVQTKNKWHNWDGMENARRDRKSCISSLLSPIRKKISSPLQILHLPPPLPFHAQRSDVCGGCCHRNWKTSLDSTSDRNMSIIRQEFAWNSCSCLTSPSFLSLSLWSPVSCASKLWCLSVVLCNWMKSVSVLLTSSVRACHPFSWIPVVRVVHLWTASRACERILYNDCTGCALSICFPIPQTIWRVYPPSSVCKWATRVLCRSPERHPDLRTHVDVPKVLRFGPPFCSCCAFSWAKLFAVCERFWKSVTWEHHIHSSFWKKKKKSIMQKHHHFETTTKYSTPLL